MSGVTAMAAMKFSRSVYAAKLREWGEIAFVDEAAFQHRGKWGPLFRQRIGAGFEGRMIFEVGCFDAVYLCRIAARYPQVGFIGLDWKCKAIYEGAQRIAKSGLRNVVLLRGRAQEVLKIFGGGEVDEVWVFHPDPCDRPAELKNRLIAEPFLKEVHSVLREGDSNLFLKTDHPGYYQWVLGLLGLREPTSFQLPSPRIRSCDLMRLEDIPLRSEAVLRRFAVVANSSDFWNDPFATAAVEDRCFAGEMTLFESRFIRKKLPIYFLQLGRRATPFVGVGE